MKPKAVPLIRFDQVVGRLGGGVGVMGLVPGGDLESSADQGAPERVDLDPAGPGLQVVPEAGDEVERHAEIEMIIYGPDHFLGVPGGATRRTNSGAPQAAAPKITARAQVTDTAHRIWPPTALKGVRPGDQARSSLFRGTETYRDAGSQSMVPSFPLQRLHRD